MKAFYFVLLLALSTSSYAEEFVQLSSETWKKTRKQVVGVKESREPNYDGSKVILGLGSILISCADKEDGGRIIMTSIHSPTSSLHGEYSPIDLVLKVDGKDTDINRKKWRVNSVSKQYWSPVLRTLGKESEIIKSIMAGAGSLETILKIDREKSVKATFSLKGAKPLVEEIIATCDR